MIMLDEAIKDYFIWMIEKEYTESSLSAAEWALKCFSRFVKERTIDKEKIFTLSTLQVFGERRPNYLSAVRGLWRYLYTHGRIRQPLEKQKTPLPDVYEEYLLYYAKFKQVHPLSILRTRRVLCAFNEYLKKQRVSLPALCIKELDTFLAEYNTAYAPQTQQRNRSCLRGFITYLYQEQGIVRKDFAPLLVGAPFFAQSRPPKFLRPEEVQNLFANLKHSSSWDLRANAMLHLAFTLGLRPKEISLISLDDISFKQEQIYLPDRKSNNPIALPLEEGTLKAIAAYIIGVREKSKERTLFLNLNAPYAPISPARVSGDIAICMRKANLSSSAYWLRHTYAQNLLENGASIFEIKEMLGHDRIQTTQNYLHIHTTLMREVLFDETL
jgi:site-specific recombinase XerD